MPGVRAGYFRRVRRGVVSYVATNSLGHVRVCRTAKEAIAFAFGS